MEGQGEAGGAGWLVKPVFTNRETLRSAAVDADDRLGRAAADEFPMPFP